MTQRANSGAANPAIGRDRGPTWGLRLVNIEELPSEPGDYNGRQSPPLYDCGATKEQAEFLVSGGYRGRWHGERVEINVMTSDQLIAWLETKFEEHDIQKVVPEADTTTRKRHLVPTEPCVSHDLLPRETGKNHGTGKSQCVWSLSVRHTAGQSFGNCLPSTA